jgi:cell division protease FtsH
LRLGDRDELRGQIAALLGSRSAEESIVGKVSTEVSDRIRKATDLADCYVMIYEMSKQLGSMAFDRKWFKAPTFTRKFN